MEDGDAKVFFNYYNRFKYSFWCLMIVIQDFSSHFYVSYCCCQIVLTQLTKTMFHTQHTQLITLGVIFFGLLNIRATNIDNFNFHNIERNQLTLQQPIKLPFTSNQPMKLLFVPKKLIKLILALHRQIK